MFFLVGVTRKQLGFTFLGDSKQEFSSVIGDICIQVEGIDREVRALGFSSKDKIQGNSLTALALVR